MSDITNAQNEAQAQDQKSGFFDLHVTGIGYLNRVRPVTGKGVKPYLACTISAMRGNKDDSEGGEVEYTKFDVIVVGADAQKAIKLLETDVKANKAVIIGFKLGDISLEKFIYKNDVGNFKRGDFGAMIKGRLLQVKFAKVDSKTVDLPQKTPAAGAGDLPATGTDGQ